MSDASLSPRQRQTSNGRAKFLDRFPTPEARSEHFKELARRSAEGRLHCPAMRSSTASLRLTPSCAESPPGTPRDLVPPPNRPTWTQPHRRGNAAPTGSNPARHPLEQIEMHRHYPTERQPFRKTRRRGPTTMREPFGTIVDKVNDRDRQFFLDHPGEPAYLRPTSPANTGRPVVLPRPGCPRRTGRLGAGHQPQPRALHPSRRLVGRIEPLIDPTNGRMTPHR